MEIKKALIIDGNFIMMKNMFGLIKDKLLYGYFHRSLEESMKTYMNLHFWDEIYFVSDSKKSSWRKNLYPEYKATRTKSEDIDWEFVFTAYTEFKDDLSKKPNVTVLEGDSIEGDDWISHIVSEGNKVGTSFLIIASDHDLKQLMTFGLNPPYMNFMSNEFVNKEKVFVPKNYDMFMTELNKNRSMDLFEMNDNGSFHDFIRMFLEKRIVAEADPIETLVTKMISGDKSDNILSVYRKEGKTGKWMGIGDAGALKIYNKYIEEFGPVDMYDPDLLENIADLVCESKKAPLSNMESIMENVRFNQSLIDMEQIPDDIIERMKDTIEELDNKVVEEPTKDETDNWFN
jgi:5'-3' exonuclease